MKVFTVKANWFPTYDPKMKIPKSTTLYEYIGIHPLIREGIPVTQNKRDARFFVIDQDAVEVIAEEKDEKFLSIDNMIARLKYIKRLPNAFLKSFREFHLPNLATSIRSARKNVFPKIIESLRIVKGYFPNAPVVSDVPEPIAYLPVSYSDPEKIINENEKIRIIEINTEKFTSIDRMKVMRAGWEDKKSSLEMSIVKFFRGGGERMYPSSSHPIGEESPIPSPTFATKSSQIKPVQFCPSCEKLVESPNAIFCQYCGVKLAK